MAGEWANAFARGGHRPPLHTPLHMATNDSSEIGELQLELKRERWWANGKMSPQSGENPSPPVAFGN